MIPRATVTTKPRQRGVALIVVLLIVAMMATIAATMSERLFGQFHRAQNQVSYQQAYWYAIGAEALAKVAIEQSFTDSDTINLSQPWAIEEQTYPLDYGELSGKMYDKQACFNLNSLASVQQTSNQQTAYKTAVLERLLESLDVESYQAETIAHSMQDFIDSNDTVDTISGVEDNTYEAMSPAYLAPNGYISDSSEMRAVYQVTGDVMQKLAPYVCALPTDALKINVNTLDVSQAKLLAAMLGSSADESVAQNLIQGRPYDGWAQIDDFLASPALAALSDDDLDDLKDHVTVDSAYFELDAQVKVNDSRVRIRSLLFSENRETATVIRRRFGGIGERVSDRSAEQQ